MDLCSWIPVNEAETKIIRSDVAAAHNVLMVILMQDSCRADFRYAFSVNGKPTMVPIPNANVQFGEATEMSRNDITRVNTLYKC